VLSSCAGLPAECWRAPARASAKGLFWASLHPKLTPVAQGVNGQGVALASSSCCFGLFKVLLWLKSSGSVCTRKSGSCLSFTEHTLSQGPCLALFALETRKSLALYKEMRVCICVNARAYRHTCPECPLCTCTNLHMPSCLLSAPAHRTLHQVHEQLCTCRHTHTYMHTHTRARMHGQGHVHTPVHARTCGCMHACPGVWSGRGAGHNVRVLPQALGPRRVCKTAHRGRCKSRVPGLWLRTIC